MSVGKIVELYETIFALQQKAGQGMVDDAKLNMFQGPFSLTLYFMILDLMFL